MFYAVLSFTVFTRYRNVFRSDCIKPGGVIARNEDKAIIQAELIQYPHELEQ